MSRMSYKPLRESELGQELEELSPLGECLEDGEAKVTLDTDLTAIDLYDKTDFGGPNEESCGEEVSHDTQLLVSEKSREEIDLSTELTFKQESWKYRLSRRLLSLAAVLLFVGLLASAIALIAVAPTCPVDSEPRPWWRNTVIYQCYLRSFQDSDGNGSGDLNGLRNRLDHFVDTGVAAVLLSPVYPSPQDTVGYDISNYTAIDPLFYGSLADFSSLLQEMHDRDMKLVLDFIPNHSSADHPWFKESRRSKDSPRRHWYVWADGQGDGPPNNWISVFGGSAWSYDNITGQYYLHQLSDTQPDLNYSNVEVQDAMKQAIRFWLDLGVDGFRMKSVKYLLEDPSLENEARNPDFTSHNCTVNISSAECYDSLIHNLTTNYPDSYNVFRSWRQLLDSYSTPGQEKIMLADVYDPLTDVIDYYGRDGNAFDFPLNFLLVENEDWSGTSVGVLVSDWLGSVPDGASANWVLGNSETSRISSRATPHLARALNTLLLTLPGIAFTYYGEEIGMSDVFIPMDSHWERDKQRTPMQWNSSANGGFTDPGSTPWRPLAANYTLVNVAVETNNTLSALSLYQKLIKLRSSHPALQHNGYRHVYNSTETLAYLRYSDNEEDDKLMVVINLSERETALNLSGSLSLDNPIILLSSTLNHTGPVDLESVELAIGEALVVSGSCKNTCS